MDNAGKLGGQWALVTGAGHGLGLVFARALAAEGANLFLMSRNEPELKTACAEISAAFHVTCHPWRIDICQEDSVREAASFVEETAGTLDVLINNAALGRGDTPLEETPLSDWQRVIDTNLTGTFLCMKHFGKIMIAHKKGRIINLTSLAARAVFADAYTGAYDCSKAAVACLTRCMAGEWARHGIRVNSISPGFFLTDINKRFLEAHPSFYDKSTVHLPLKRWGDPPELGPLLVYLASSDSDYVTGADFAIDGGYTIW